MKNIYFFLFCFFWIYITCSYAQNSKTVSFFELAKEELKLVKSASLIYESILESPAPVSTYNKKFFERFGFTNIRDFLDYLPSFYLVQDINERVVSLRGLYTTITNSFIFLENEQKLSIPDFESFLLDASYPILDLFKIEVVYGPTSSIYGTTALAGVVSTQREFKKGFSLHTLYGEYNEKLISARISDRNIYFLAHYNDYPGEKYHNVRIHQRNDNEAIILKSRFKNTFFQFFYFHNQYIPQYSHTGMPLTSKDKSIYGAKEFANLYIISLKRDFKIGKGFFSLTPSITFFDLHSPQVKKTWYEGIEAIDIKMRTARYALDGLYKIKFWGGQLINGFSLQLGDYDKYESKFYNGTEILSKLPDKTEFNYAIFGEYKKAWKKFVFNIGARYDHYERSGSHFSPRLALIYYLKPTLTFNLNYAEAFNAPPYFYTKANPALGYGSTSDLKAELIKTYSGTINYFFNSELFLRTTFYLEDSRNKIGYDPKNKVYANLKRLKLIGTELEMKYTKDPFLIFMNYTWIDLLEKEKYGETCKCKHQICGIPKWMIKGGISYKIPWVKEFYISPLFKWIGKTCWKEEKYSSYAIFDLNIFHKPTKNIKIDLKIENLFDKHYKRSGILPHVNWNGRLINFSLTLSF